MKELFLIAALSLPGNVYRATPHWNFGPPEVKIVRMLRDWPNGHTASRPSAWILIYGQHPLWTYKLREDGMNVIGFYRRKVRWPGYIMANPLHAPFRDGQFQVYIFDDFAQYVSLLAPEVSRLVAPWGFFLYRYTKNGDFAHALMGLGWERFELDFHEFTIWWRPKNYTHIKMNMSVILDSSA